MNLDRNPVHLEDEAIFLPARLNNQASPTPLPLTLPFTPAGVIFCLVPSWLFSFIFFLRQKAKPRRIFQLNVQRQ